MIDISRHITYLEATHTNTGLPNEPSVAEIKSMQHVAQTVFEPLRGHYNIPIDATSFFRSILVNKIVGGAITSQHTKGEAMDLKAKPETGLTNKQIFEYIKDNLYFDQLIGEFPDKNGEFRWVHVSLTKGNNRSQVLISKKVKGKTVYQTYK